MKFVTYEDRDGLMARLSAQIVTELAQGLETGERATLCVPGGSTPGPIFDALAQADLDWAHIDIMLNDERWVDESSPRSNTALLKRRLLIDKAAPATLVPLYADAPTPEDGLSGLMPAVEAALPLQVLVLGMGADMHTASLFPKADQLALGLSDDAPNLLAMRAEGAGEPRITLSAKALKTAVHTHILIVGDEKRDALEKAAELDEIDAPVRAFLDQATVHWAP